VVRCTHAHDATAGSREVPGHPAIALHRPHRLHDPALHVTPAVVAELADPGDQLEKPGDPIPIPEGVPVELPCDARGERDVLRLHWTQGCVMILGVCVAGEVS